MPDEVAGDPGRSAVSTAAPVVNRKRIMERSFYLLVIVSTVFISGIDKHV